MVAAFAAGHSGPLIKAHIGASAVVRSKRLGHDREEIQQPALLKRPAQRCGGFALAEFVVADVGMRDGIVNLGAVRLQRDNAILGPLVESRDVEHNLKGAEQHAVQTHRLGGHGDLPGLERNAKSGELAIEGHKVVIDLASGGRSRWRGLVKFHPHHLERPAQLIQAAGNFPATDFGSVTPAALFRHREEFHAAEAGGPGGDRQLRNLSRRRRAASESRRHAHKQSGVIHRRSRLL
jgi:hypothetical protein